MAQRFRRPSSVRGTEIIRNLVFGVEDSLVSTVGLVSGIAVANVPASTVLLTGVTLIFVEAFSMGVGSFLSEEAAYDYASRRHSPIAEVLVPAATMFISYLLVGLVPLVPYLLMPPPAAIGFSILLTLSALFGFGALTGVWVHKSPWRRAMEMLVLGGGAVFIGVLVGTLFTRGG